MDLDLTKMRYRTKGSSATRSTGHWSWNKFSPKGILLDSGNFSWPIVTAYEKTEMWDVSTPGFKKRSASGQVINSPMKVVHEIAKCPAYAVTEYTPHTSGLYYTGSGTYGILVPTYKLSVPQRYIDNAITSAFSKVTITESDTLLWLGEMRESIEMFYSMGQSLLKLARLTKKQRDAYFKGKLSVKEAQSLTLQIQYGILPLEQQFQSWCDGLLKTLPPGRKTVRGFGKYEDSTTYDYVNPEQNWEIRSHVEETLEANIRAGVLFDVDPPAFPQAAFVEPRAIFTTAYALARLSFVIDWFINVGPTIAAWSPTVGTNILTAWVAVEEIHTVTCTDKQVGVKNDWEVLQNISGQTTGIRQWIIKTRYPVSLADRPIFPRITLDLNLSKIASLILLFAKAK